MRFLAMTDLHGDLPAIDLDAVEYDAILLNGDFGFDEEQRYAVQELEGDMKQQTIENAYEQAERLLDELEDREEPVYMVPGNWDLQAYERYHDDRPVTDIDHDAIELHDHQIIGYGAYENPTRPELPLYSDNLDQYPDRETRETAFFERKDMIAEYLDEETTTDILLTHNAPQGTGLDLVETTNGEKYIGSIVVREMIENHEPDYVISGHVHEAPGETTIGQTRVINAGYRGAVLIDTATDSIEWLTDHEG